MSRISRIRFGARAALLVSAMAFSLGASAQDDEDYDNHVLSDGKLSEEELASVVAVAQKHLKEMTEVSVEAVGKQMKEAGVFQPMAWMLMKNGDIKAMKLGESGEEAPGDIKVIMYRAGLKSIARQKEIHASLIAYPGKMEKDGEEVRIMAVEHEHRLGVSGLKLIPVTLSSGEAEFGEVISQDKPFQIFYDEKKKSS